ncbi:hypothetical protein NW801_22000 [Brevibacillus laterosporus]|uniref:Uncharacterized protein n=1 Tax=Brevibacillus halotolerans TaxID=1507437 RepID=A0ABT4I4M5_9BACL|nr:MULTISPECIES: hypothetical protein [Brevibacillus]MCR8987666.1 hypothetical protein [Brevibacillus laterosporus]MCZ0833405.1 hypothetical protein [Brevibacillus halotolerans]
MNRKILLLGIVLLVVYISYRLWEWQSNRQWVDLEAKKSFFRIPSLQECNCEDDRKNNHEENLYLSPKDTVINFFGYLKSKEYENVISFFDPDISFEYFYKKKKAEEILTGMNQYGEALSRNQTLQDIRFLSEQRLTNGITEFEVQLKFVDMTLTKIIQIKQTYNKETTHKDSFIMTQPQELLP